MNTYVHRGFTPQNFQINPRPPNLKGTITRILPHAKSSVVEGFEEGKGGWEEDLKGVVVFVAEEEGDLMDEIDF